TLAILDRDEEIGTEHDPVVHCDRDISFNSHRLLHRPEPNRVVRRAHSHTLLALIAQMLGTFLVFLIRPEVAFRMATR
ncbi:MAG TPA: hypothetical protein VHM29_06900, partial [Acidimicrobiia bacterium]|nr:hypothetical protein [Acidimicrobiia bacterium]